MPNELKIHPAADSLPRLSEAEFQELKADIAKRGQREPILKSENILLDGRHRLRAGKELGIEPVFAEYANDGGRDFMAEIFSRNILRRHLTADQRAMLVAKLRGDSVSAAAKARIKAHQFGSEPTAVSKSTQPERTHERIAKEAKVSHFRRRSPI